MTEKLKPNANQAIIQHLQESIEKLESLTTIGSSCSIEDEHKKAVRNYVNNWVLPRLRITLEWAKGKKLERKDKY